MEKNIFFIYIYEIYIYVIYRSVYSLSVLSPHNWPFKSALYQYTQYTPILRHLVPGPARSAPMPSLRFLLHFIHDLPPERRNDAPGATFVLAMVWAVGSSRAAANMGAAPVAPGNRKLPFDAHI